jgi:hypothetical protein
MGGDLTPPPIYNRSYHIINALNMLSFRLVVASQGPLLTHHISYLPHIQVFTSTLCEMIVSCGIFPLQQVWLFVFIPLDLPGVSIHMGATTHLMIFVMNSKWGESYQFMATSTLPKTFSSASIASLYEYMDKDFSNREKHHSLVCTILSKIKCRLNIQIWSLCVSPMSISFTSWGNRKSSELRN